MYQTIVLGLGFLLLAGGGYLITHVRDEGVLSSALEKKVIIATSTDPGDHSQTVSGKYLCDESHGCADPKMLILTDDTEARLITTFANGGETLDEQGSWNLNEKGELTISIEGNTQGLYDKASHINLKVVTPRTVITISGSTYNGWGMATFRKELDGDE